MGTTIEFKSQLTETEFREFEHMSRTAMYWVDVVLSSVVWMWVAGLILWISSKVFHPNPVFGVFVLVLIVGGFLSFLYSLKQEWKQKLARLNATIDRFVLADNGVEWHAPDGKIGLLRWNRVYGWREGRHVILLENSEVKFVILPVTNLSENERRPIQQFLRSHIASALGKISDTHSGPSYPESQTSNPTNERLKS